ncbi:ATP-binding cassette domain-containing protein [Alteromonas sp. McT4-15]|uniref:ATP-binding cassette domain-containing protein n=1 Tax=Alteromonas sp. McT4-15 TaxID=2881256 RepID=UPI001CF82EBE|nr:ATP-binding cassette domain-containing protein [Alteromonas sp. McT4-15]MCB4436775.1 ATP-binding cassette domain-containing protein [Alteromonas sp. McT4-15]
MLSLFEFALSLPSGFKTPAFSIDIQTPCGHEKPTHYIVAGRNGAGKSLLLSAIAGDGKTVAGKREFDSEVAQVSIAAQQALIEEERRKDSADILDVIATPTRVRELFTRTNTDYINHPFFNTLVTILRIEHLLDAEFLALSTGETRKVIIVMAWLSNAKLIVLDEPFEGLDIDSAKAFSQFLTSQQQATLVITANKLSDIPQGIIAYVIVMENLAVTWRSEKAISYESIIDELSTWFALSYDAVSLPQALLSHQITTSNTVEDKASPQVLISLKKGYVRYDGRTIFENLDFTVTQHTHWQIVGPNGSGKTCLLQMITGDNPHCYTNELTLFGIKRGTGESIWDIKKHIGIMSNALHMQYKVNANLEHVILSGFYDSIGLYTKASQEEKNCAAEWLTVLGMEDKKHTPFQSLSFGDQRLVLLARAMVKHPTLLILDEPCNGLDEFNRQKILKFIDIVANAKTSTVLYVTHHEDESLPSIPNRLDMQDYGPVLSTV